MKPSRPYLLRALYDWMLDCDLTPHVAVDAEWEGVNVPFQFVKDGQIILNIAPGAVRGLAIEDDALFFNARFGGVSTDIYVPIGAVLAIYAREGGQGMGFGMEPAADLYQKGQSDPEPPPEKQSVPPKRKAPTLKVVK